MVGLNLKRGISEAAQEGWVFLSGRKANPKAEKCEGT